MRSLADRPGVQRLVAFVLAASTLVLVAVPARAETIESGTVLIREDDVVDEDLYVAANRVQIDGLVEGDLTVAAFGEVVIEGDVEGTVTALASRVEVTGTVGGSLRVLSPEVAVTGKVDGDILTATFDLDVGDSGVVGRDVITAAWGAELAGAVGRKVEGAIRNVTLGGRVEDTVEVVVRNLVVEEGASIGGDLAYRSERDADISADATVEGSVLTRRPLSPNVRVAGLGIMIRVLLVLFGAALGLSVVWAATERSEAAGASVLRRLGPALGWGLAAVSTPVVLGLLVVLLLSVTPPESSLPLLAVFIPLMAGVAGLLVLGALLAPVPPALAVGSRMMAERSAYARFLAGFAVVAGLALLPVVGRWILVVTVAVGLGAWLVAGDGE